MNRIMPLVGWAFLLTLSLFSVHCNDSGSGTDDSGQCQSDQDCIDKLGDNWYCDTASAACRPDRSDQIDGDNLDGDTSDDDDDLIPDDDDDDIPDDDDDDTTDGDQTGEPNIQVDRELVMNGALNTPMQKDLVIKNAGTGDLILDSIDWDTTLVEYSLQNLPTFPATVPPTASVSITVVYTMSDPAGQNNDLVIECNDPDSSQVTVTVKGQVVGEPRVKLNHEEIDFGMVVVNNRSTQSLTITNDPSMSTATAPLRLSNFRIQAADGQTPPFEYQLLECADCEEIWIIPDDALALSLAFTPTEEGEKTASLLFDTNDPNQSTVALPLSGEGGTPVLTLDPVSLEFGNLAVNANNTMSFDLVNNGELPITLNGLSFDNPNLDFNAVGWPGSGTPILPTGRRSVSVMFNPTQDGLQETMVVVQSNAEGSPHYVPISGTGIQTSLTVEPASHDFGPTLVGALPTVDVVLRNNGDEAVEIDTIQRNASLPFYLSSALGWPIEYPLTIQGNASYTLRVEFRPTTADSFTDTFTFNVLALNEDPTFVVSGEGARPSIDVRDEEGQVVSGFVSFGEVAILTEASYTLTISNQGNYDLSVQELQFQGGSSLFYSLNVTGPFTIAPGGDQEITLSFRPNAVNGNGLENATFFINSNDPNNNSIQVSATATAVAPEAEVTPDPYAPTAVDLGQIVTDRELRQTLQIRNIGQGELVIQEPTLSSVMDPNNPYGLDFGELNFPLRLTPEDEAKTFELIFHPTQGGAFPVSVQIDSNDFHGTRLDVEFLAGAFDCPVGQWDVDDDPSDCEYECTQTYGGDERCDGQDNDCDGLEDELFNLGDSCYLPFPCGTGQWICDPTNDTQAICSSYTNAQPEVCDGLDNSCSGYPDDGEPCPAKENAEAICISASCHYSCFTGYHLCAEACVDNSSPDHCGGSCTPCTAPENGVPTCESFGLGYACDFDCVDPYEKIGEECGVPGQVDNCGIPPVNCLTEYGGHPANGQRVCVNAACSVVCDPGYHYDALNDYCAPNISPDCCGEFCMECTAPDHGTPYCNGGSCSWFCEAGFHQCGNTCAADDSPLTCGTSCTPCPQVYNGERVCENGQCGFACDTNYHPCNEQCLYDFNANHCGTRCEPCPEPANATPRCTGEGECAFDCFPGFHECDIDDEPACVTNSSLLHCGDRCNDPCPEPDHSTAQCNGVECSFVCELGYHRCGEECVSDYNVNSCGNRCEPCETIPNTTVSCNGVQCVYACTETSHYCGAPYDGCVDNNALATCGSRCEPCPEPDHTSSSCDCTDEDGCLCNWVCLDDYYDRDGDPANGCESYCVFESETDDLGDGIDQNCDGIDGELAKAVFVSINNGYYNGPGTMDKPYDRLEAGLDALRASPDKEYILAARGVYYEEISIQDGDRIYGGYNVHGGEAVWTPPTELDPGNLFLEPSSNIGLVVADIVSPTLLSHVSVTSADSDYGSQSSYGVQMTNVSSAFVWDGGEIYAGRGDHGVDGANGEPGISGGDGQNGTAGRADSQQVGVGGQGGESSCGSGGYRGGNGGDHCLDDGDNGAGNGTCSDHDPPGDQPSCGGLRGWRAGTAFDQAGSGGDGGHGQNGSDGTNGLGASGGMMEEETHFWISASGTAGEAGSSGTPGGGGGGGGGGDSSVIQRYSDTGGGGGGGGAGGCAGGAGQGGTGGGGSFGLFLINSSPTLQNLTIITSDGGQGGNGGYGTAGGQGGTGGLGGCETPSQTPGDCSNATKAADGGDGGNGGNGGAGGHGGGGAGGPSVCLFKTDDTSLPVYDILNVSCQAGTPGTGGESLCETCHGENGLTGFEN